MSAQPPFNAMISEIMSSLQAPEMKGNRHPSTPSDFSCSATCLPAFTDLLVKTTREPAVANAFTVSTPIPLLPPVTNDVLPALRSQLMVPRLSHPSVPTQSLPAQRHSHSDLSCDL